MSVPRHLKALVALAEDHGWTYDTTTKGHPRLTPPADVDCAPIVMAGTPSDHRGIRNAEAHLRRCGVPVPHKGHTPKKEK